MDFIFISYVLLKFKNILLQLNLLLILFVLSIIHLF